MTRLLCSIYICFCGFFYRAIYASAWAGVCVRAFVAAPNQMLIVKLSTEKQIGRHKTILVSQWDLQTSSAAMDFELPFRCACSSLTSDLMVDPFKFMPECIYDLHYWTATFSYETKAIQSHDRMWITWPRTCTHQTWLWVATTWLSVLVVSLIKARSPTECITMWLQQGKKQPWNCKYYYYYCYSYKLWCVYLCETRTKKKSNLSRLCNLWGLWGQHLGRPLETKELLSPSWIVFLSCAWNFSAIFVRL